MNDRHHAIAEQIVRREWFGKNQAKHEADRKPTANVGEIVIAILDNDYTIKELGKENGLHILIPHNDNFDIIRPKDGFEIEGVVTATYRKYGKPTYSKH